MRKTIGLLGGIGPASSAQFCVRLIDRFKKEFHPASNADFPHFILNSISAGDLIDGEGGNIPQYIEGLKMLEGVSDVIAVVCNTAHVYYDDFVKSISKPIIDLRKEVEMEILKRNTKRVTVLATPASIAAGLYTFESCRHSLLEPTEINALGALIKKINLGTYTIEDAAELNSIFSKYEKQSDVVILGCTEIADALRDNNSDKKLDTLDVLLNAVLREYVS